MTTVTRTAQLRTGGRLIAAALTLALIGASCTSGGLADRDDTVVLDRVTPVAALEPFDSCDALLDGLRGAALDRVGPYGLEGSSPHLPFEEGVVIEGDFAAPAVRESAGGAADVESAPSGGGEGGVSGTNVQEAGVDEPDLVKADRERMVVVTNGRLSVVDLTGDEPAIVGRLDLPFGYDHELLVAGDRALVLTREDTGRWPEDIGDFSAGPASTTVTTVDLGDPRAPAVDETLHFEGRYVSARMQGTLARVVVSSPPPDLGFVYPAAATESAEARAEAVNASVIEESTLDDWLPAWTLDRAGTDTSGRLDACDSVHRPAEIAGFGLVSVLTVDLEEGLTEPEPVSVMGAAETVYASAGNLYVAVEHVDEPDLDDPTPDPAVPDDQGIDIAPQALDVRTTVHRFSAPADGPVEYQASGEVEGRLLNQFSMSEHEGVLRVATTRGEPWLTESTDSLVTTLEQQGDQLVELGRVTDLGRGEEIFAVRFVGPVGYVVTFRQTDPLYVVDLRDPAGPTVSGELKILGYSAYLHPIDDTHVLGVGQDADEDGRTSGTQVSLFDVSDPAAPVRTAQVTLPGSTSEVEWDHRAFLWWAPTGTAVIPVETYELDYSAGAVVIDVDAPAGALSERGQIDRGGSPVRRSVIVDDTLVTLDSSALVFSGLGDLGRRAELPL